jgi:outer membrane lipopolysaccharide assembly protein LptE/RlpB
MGELERSEKVEGRGKARAAAARRSASVSRIPSALASLVLALSAGALAGCGYHLVGHSNSLPARLQKLYVTPLVNQSGRAELDQRLTDAITREWVRRGRFQLVSGSEQADVVLSGTIVAAVTSPVQFDSSGRATQYQLTVVADMQLVDRTGAKPVVLWRDQQFSRSAAYQVNVNAAEYFDQSVEAMDTLSRDFARGLVTTILEGF